MSVIMQINFMDKKLILLFVFATTIVTSHSQPFYGWTADATTIAENNFEIKAKAPTIVEAFAETAETGLPISGGLSSARFISKMATNEAKPNGFLEIPHGKETEFLWPMGIEKINGVGKQTEQHLKSFGIYTIEDIAKTPIEHLERIAGKWGEAL
jgi:nucleotidyltransferase/DNA polymerase involved in DNA repair